MKYLNLACGSRFHTDWTNIDFVSDSEYVMAHNLLTGIPFPENHFDAVYASHVLGHFSKEKGVDFLKECFRVLKPGGVIRVVVPDLEQLVKEYLNALEEVSRSENEMTRANYDWSLIEMIDEMVREKPGGEMLKYWQQETIVNEDQVVKRLGHEYTRIREYIVQAGFQTSPVPVIPKTTLKTKIKKFLFRKLHLSEENVELGNFRNSGELYKWMYDRYSIRRLFGQIGFKDITVQSAGSSYISDWEKYLSLDMENGKIRKPDSLFMEAKK